MYIEDGGYTALITGASSGLGLEMAKTLLAHGARVIIAARGRERLASALEELKKLGEAYALPMDVRSEASVQEASEWFTARFDRLDLLVNNAGIGNNAPGMETLPPDHAFYDLPAATVKDILDTNLLGFFLVTRSFVPRMLRQGSGSVVYVSTSSGTMTGRGQFPYGPSKAGAEAMAALMAEELRERGIAVNVICPGGFTDTNMAPPGAKEAFLKSGRPILPPAVLNETILFLASSAARGISGEKLVGKDFPRWLRERGLSFPDGGPETV